MEGRSCGELGNEPGVKFVQWMQTRFIPLPADVPPMDLPEFQHRVRTDPVFVAKMWAHYEGMLAEPLTPETAEMRERAGKALATLKHFGGIAAALRKLKEGERLMHESVPEHREQIAVLLAEAMDELLDVMEPERARFIKVTMALQAHLQSLAADGGVEP